jgi:hypothetical protein
MIKYRSLLFLTLLTSLFLLPAQPQGTMSLPFRAPVYCMGKVGAGVVNACSYPFVLPNTTGILICRQCQASPPVDNHGDVWHQDQCSPFDNGDCAYSTHFNVSYETGGPTVTFPAGEGFEVFLLMYSGNWTFDQGQIGTYDQQNSAFSDCTNGGDCPYHWTLPVEVDPGELLITWDNANTYNSGIAVPGFGWNIEGNGGNFAIEDMIAPVRSSYIGSMQWNDLTGYNGGGSHWLMGIAAYVKQ